MCLPLPTLVASWSDSASRASSVFQASVASRACTSGSDSAFLSAAWPSFLPVHDPNPCLSASTFSRIPGPLSPDPGRLSLSLAGAELWPAGAQHRALVRSEYRSPSWPASRGRQPRSWIVSCPALAGCVPPIRRLSAVRYLPPSVRIRLTSGCFVSPEQAFILCRKILVRPRVGHGDILSGNLTVINIVDIFKYT